MIPISSTLLYLCAVVAIARATDSTAQKCEPRSTSIDCLFPLEKLDQLSHPQQVLNRMYHLARKFSIQEPAVTELLGVVEELRATQKPNPFLERSDSEKLAHLAEFARYCGKYAPEVELVEVPDAGIGTRVNRDIPEDGDIFNVGLHDTLNLVGTRRKFGTQKTDQLAQILRKTTTTQFSVLWDRHAWLALDVVAEQLNPESKFRSYIQNLPTKFSLFTYFTADDYKLLRGTQGYADAIQSYMDLIQQYALIRAYLDANPDFLRDYRITPDTLTFDIYRWAWSIVLTRAWEDETNHLLIPCWDMANHGSAMMDTDFTYQKPSKYTERHHGEVGALRAYALKAIKAGQEILHEYNDASSTIDHFLNTWGIPNPNASLHILFNLTTDMPDYATKLKLLQQFQLDTDYEMKLVQNHDTLISDIDFPYLIIVASAATPPLEPRGIPSPVHWSGAWTYLGGLIDKALSTYQLNSAQIAEKLENDKLTDNQRLILTTSKYEQEFLVKAKIQCASLANGTPRFIDWKKAWQDEDWEMRSAITTESNNEGDESESDEGDTTKPFSEQDTESEEEFDHDDYDELGDTEEPMDGPSRIIEMAKSEL